MAERYFRLSVKYHAACREVLEENETFKQMLTQLTRQLSYTSTATEVCTCPSYNAVDKSSHRGRHKNDCPKSKKQSRRNGAVSDTTAAALAQLVKDMRTSTANKTRLTLKSLSSVDDAHDAIPSGELTAPVAKLLVELHGSVQKAADVCKLSTGAVYYRLKHRATEPDDVPPTGVEDHAFHFANENPHR